MGLMPRPAERGLCPFCGTTVLGDPWAVKAHVQVCHRDRVSEFTPHLYAMIRRWVKT